MMKGHINNWSPSAEIKLEGILDINGNKERSKINIIIRMGPKMILIMLMVRYFLASFLVILSVDVEITNYE